MSRQSRPVRCISCSIFRQEIEALQASGQLDLPVDFLNSMLHMVPTKLEARLQVALEESRMQAPGQNVVIAYDDCCGPMENITAEPGTSRTDGSNTILNILLPETCQSGRMSGAIMHMPQ